MKPLQRKADKICEILKKTYPDVKTQLRHDNPFELLVATILSAQCTDKQVNAVTPKLFGHLKTPRDFSNADLESLEALIRPTGYFRNKARHIRNCSKVYWKDTMAVSRIHWRNCCNFRAWAEKQQM